MRSRPAEVDDEQELDEFQAALELGEKLMEMADRLEPIERIQPGAQATWAFHIDGVRFSLVLSVASRGSNNTAEPA